MAVSVNPGAYAETRCFFSMDRVSSVEVCNGTAVSDSDEGTTAALFLERSALYVPF
jgi:hypothetical protein